MWDPNFQAPGNGTKEALPPLLQARAKRSLYAALFGVASIPLLTALVQVLAVSVFELIVPEITKSNVFLILMSAIPMYLVAMPLSLLFFRLEKGDAPQTERRVSPLVLLGLLALSFAIAWAGNLVSTLINSVISRITGEPTVNETAKLMAETPLWANLLVVGILAPILEELFYRKLVIDRLRVFGDLAAVLLSGLLFGLIHGNFDQLFYAVGFGCMAGYLYLYTGKIRYTVILHVVFNLIGGVFSSELARHLPGGTMPEDPFVLLEQTPWLFWCYEIYGMFTMACLAATPVVLVLLWKHIRFERREGDPTLMQTAGILIRHPATWTMLAVAALLFVL